MDSMYDEFGNYCGPDLDDDNDSTDDISSPTHSHTTDDDLHEWEQQDDPPQHTQRHTPTTHNLPHQPPPSQQPSTAIALPTHGAQALTKQYYPSAEQLYGTETEVIVGDEDAQPIEQPLIAPVRVKQWGLSEAQLPLCSWDWRFMAGMMDHPTLIRHTALIGALHSGKTALLDLLIQHTHTLPGPPSRYTDVRKDEQSRGISIKSQPMSFILPTLTDKSFLINTIDTPGHIDFADERTAALRLADAAIVVVDIAEGLQVTGERALRQAVRFGLRVMLVVAKLDRLIVELRLPPADAYHRIVHCVEEVNTVLRSSGYRHRLLSPHHNNVCFASPAHDYIFSLRSFAKLYCDRSPTPVSYQSFARKLWGNQYVLPSGQFTTTAPSSSHPRTFVHFVLQPLYKLYSHVLGSEGQELRQLLAELGVEVTVKEMKLQARELLRLVCGRFFGDVKGFTDMVVESTPAASEAGRERVEYGYRGSADDGVGRQMSECDRRGQLMVHVTKLYCRSDAAIFDSFGRVYSGSIKVGDRVRVLGERYSAEDDEDVSERIVSRIWIFNARYRVEVSGVSAGNWALFEGIDPSITKTATITSPLTTTTHSAATTAISTFIPLHFDTIATMKVAIEPLHPSDLPKMLDGLRALDKSYPLCSTRVEESGEHVLLGVGELYMDVLLYDLRLQYGDVEVRVSDPVVRFSEGVSEASVMEVSATSANGANRLSMLCEPIEREMAEEMESGLLRGVVVSGDKVRDEARVRQLEDRYGWDVLQSRSIWAFGPDEQGPNMLVDETLPSETDKALLYSCRDSIVQGFAWGTREGPLCDEPIRQCKFRLLSANLATDSLLRTRGQLIPTARRCLYSAFLLASPRLLEPVYASHILAPADCITALSSALRRRRGHILSSSPLPASPLYSIVAHLPLIDSFGFEVDIRTATQGQAAVQSSFDHWDVVPGDPLDDRVGPGKGVNALERVEGEGLARDFMVKTRRRKGLVETVDPRKYLDASTLEELLRMTEGGGGG